MSLSELNGFLEKLDENTPAGGKNFWDRRHWIDEVEGRWQSGIPQYRISYSAVPEARIYWWYWYLNQDRESFDRHVHELADEGFALVQSNSYVRPGGSERFQGVWHKLVPLTHAALLPPGRYKLTEIEQRPVTGWVASLVIEGERMTGRTMRREFKGSVRDRYTGSVTVQDSSETWGGDLNTEVQFLKLLENSSWQEKDGKLRVIKEGKTVLCFEPDPAQDPSVEPKK